MTDEITALRRVAQVLARVATPSERQNIARRVAQKSKGDDSELALSLPHAAALFWPGHTEKTAEVLSQITRAFDAGELGGFIPREHRHVMFDDFAVWPDCPAMAADSPLRHWLPLAPTTASQPEPQAAPVHVLPRKTRRDLLAPLIEAAQKQCQNPTDANAVWLVLTAQAERKVRPFAGVTEDGLKWLDSNDDPRFLSLKSLRGRISRKPKKPR